MKVLLIIVFFLGIIITLLGYFKSQTYCPKEKIVYRFVDQTLEERQKGDKQDVYGMFEYMFQNRSILA